MSLNINLTYYYYLMLMSLPVLSDSVDNDLVASSLKDINIDFLKLYLEDDIEFFMKEIFISNIDADVDIHS